MIILEVCNHGVNEMLCNYFESEKQQPGEKVKIEHKIADHDDVMYYIKHGSGQRTILVSIKLACFEELTKYDVVEFLRKQYGDLLLDQPEPGYSVTLSIDLNKIPDDYEQLARSCAMLRRHCMASVFVKFFDLQPNLTPKSSVERATIHFRSDGAMYIQALPDRVTVIYSITFKEQDDIVLGKVFIQEFTQSLKRIDRAPTVLCSQGTPPAELQGTDAVAGESLVYFTFVLYPRHINTGPTREKAIDLLTMFPAYLHYHIKCSKAYLQMRIRSKTTEFIKAINLAYNESPANCVVNAADKF